jgi:acetyltransferase EpsM
MKQVVILGSGGQARVVIDAIESQHNARILGLVDGGDSPPHPRYPTLGRDEDVPRLWASLGAFDLMVAIGNNAVRRRVVDKLMGLEKLAYLTLIHPQAHMAGEVQVGCGSFVAIGATLCVGARLGQHVLINTNASVDHDCVVEDYAFIAPHAALGGAVHVGAGAMVGMGAVVLPGLTVGAGAVVAAGAVVTKNVADGTTVMGVPARAVRAD